MEALEAVEATGHAHTLQSPDVKAFVGHTHHEVAEVLELAVGFTLGHDAGHCRLTHVLDATHAVTNLTFLVDRELVFRLVDIGTKHVDFHSLAFLRHEVHLLDVTQLVIEHSSHKLCRIVRLEVSRLVRNPAVACRVRLVEGIGSKLLPFFPNLLQALLHLFFRKVLSLGQLGHTLFHELAIEFLHLRQLLLTHGLTKRIGLTSREVGQLAREQHHLLLIHADAVSVLQVLFHAVEIVLDLLPTLLTGNEVRDVVHRAGTV